MLANPQNNIRRGFCVVEAADQINYDCVLHSSQIPFLGKILNISPFVLDKTSIHYDTDYLQRQVIVKAIPIQVETHTIVDLFEKLIGKINRLYEVLNPNIFSDVTWLKFQSTKCYLFELCMLKSAEKAKKLGFLYLSWSKTPISIHGFDETPQSIQCKQIFINQRSIPDYCNLDCKLANRDVDVEIYNSLGYSRPVMAKLRHAELFFHKPTSKIYHSTRKRPADENARKNDEKRSKVLDEISYGYRLSAVIPRTQLLAKKS